MAASSQDKFQIVGNETATTLAANMTSGDTAITVASTAGWPTTTGVTFAIDSVTMNGTEEVQTAGTYTLYHGVVANGTTINSITLASDSPNSAQSYAAGSLTRVYMPISTEHHNLMVEGLLTEHNQDGTHNAVTATTVTTTTSTITDTISEKTAAAGVTIDGVKLKDSLMNPQYLAGSSEFIFDHIASGCVWSGDAYASTRNASCTSGVVYLAGKRLTVAAVTARSFTASKDVYCDLKDNGDGTAVWVYTDNTTNAASPALTAGNLRGAIVVVGASSIANVGSVNMGEEDKVLPIASSIPYAVTDSLGNLICPRDPQRKILGKRQITTAFSSATVAGVDVTGLSAPVIVPTGRKIKASVVSSSIQKSGTATENLIVNLKCDTTVIAIKDLSLAGSNYRMAGDVSAVHTPAAGAHTYLVTMSSSNAGTMIMNATSTSPAYVLVELA